jgi:hypothetical protein
MLYRIAFLIVIYFAGFLLLECSGSIYDITTNVTFSVLSQTFLNCRVFCGSQIIHRNSSCVCHYRFKSESPGFYWCLVPQIFESEKRDIKAFMIRLNYSLQI